MSNISVKLNLRQLKSTVRTMKGASGEIECVIIPIDANHLVRGEKGIYLDLMGFELKEKKDDSKQTHIVKQSLPKEVYEVMTDEQKRELPIVGNMIYWGHREPAPQEFAVADSQFKPEEDDLPF